MGVHTLLSNIKWRRYLGLCKPDSKLGGVLGGTAQQHVGCWLWSRLIMCRPVWSLKMWMVLWEYRLMWCRWLVSGCIWVYEVGSIAYEACTCSHWFANMDNLGPVDMLSCTCLFSKLGSGILLHSFCNWLIARVASMYTTWLFARATVPAVRCSLRHRPLHASSLSVISGLFAAVPIIEPDGWMDVFSQVSQISQIKALQYGLLFIA